MSKLTLGSVAVLVVLLILAVSAEGKEPKPQRAESCSGCNQPVQEPAGNGNGSDCICLYYPWAFYESYWSYYAIDCRNYTPLSYDAPPESPTGYCEVSGENCEHPGCYVAPPAAPGAPARSPYGPYYVHEPTRQQGLGVKGQRDYTIEMPVAAGAKVLARLFATIVLPKDAGGGPNREIYAKLFIATVEPPSGLAAFEKPLGVGIEIKKKPPDDYEPGIPRITVKDPEKVVLVGPVRLTKQNAFTRCIQIKTDVEPGTFQVITKTKLTLSTRRRAAR